jgi:hypothetical protein
MGVQISAALNIKFKVELFMRRKIELPLLEVREAGTQKCHVIVEIRTTDSSRVLIGCCLSLSYGGKKSEEGGGSFCDSLKNLR